MREECLRNSAIFLAHWFAAIYILLRIVPKQEWPKFPFFPSKLALAILSSDSYNSTQLENPENSGFNGLLYNSRIARAYYAAE